MDGQMRFRIASDFIADESGATAIEYALLGTLIAVALFATFALVGNQIGAVFGSGTGGAAAIVNEQTAKIN